MSATEYFNDTVYYNATNNYPESSFMYSGYNLTGYMYNTSFCLYGNTSTSSIDLSVDTDFCSLNTTDIFSATEVWEDNYASGNNPGAGIIGFGNKSPVW